MKCVNGEAEYRGISIDGIVMEDSSDPRHPENEPE